MNYYNLLQWYNKNKNCYFIKKGAKDSEEYTKILSLTSFLNEYYDTISLSQRMWHIENDIFEIQKCEICGNIVKFERHIKYYKTCCKTCNIKYRNSDELKQKTKNTNIERYGVEWSQQSVIIKQKMIDNNIKKYGVVSTSKLQNVKNKMLKTNLEKYSGTGFASDKNREKQRKTMIERYGAENPSFITSILQRGHLTKIKNNSYQKSKEEDEFYQDLVLLFGEHNVIRQYQDERYYNKITNKKFVCDFYVKSLDLFIEYDGHWSHKPQYLKEKERNEFIKKLNNKNTEYSQSMLKAYYRDIEKRNISKINNLNIEFVPSNKLLRHI